MANRMFFGLKGQGEERIVIHGSFRPAGTGAVTNVKGKGFTVARTGVGVFQVNFVDSFVDLEACFFGLREAAGALHSLQGGDWDSAAKTLDIRLFNATVVADLAADADNEVSFMAIFKNTSLS